MVVYQTHTHAAQNSIDKIIKRVQQQHMSHMTNQICNNKKHTILSIDIICVSCRNHPCNKSMRHYSCKTIEMMIHTSLCISWKHSLKNILRSLSFFFSLFLTKKKGKTMQQMQKKHKTCMKESISMRPKKETKKKKRMQHNNKPNQYAWMHMNEHALAYNT